MSEVDKNIKQSKDLDSEIVVTEAMIEAGVRVISPNLADIPLAELVEQAFLAMIQLGGYKLSEAQGDKFYLSHDLMVPS